METALTLRSNAPAEVLPQITPENMQKALAIGDISQMSDEMRVQYYVATCESIGLNPMTTPFDVIRADSGKMILYPNMRAAEQLRMRYRVSIDRVTREKIDDLFIVTAYASTRDGRKDEAQGIVVLSKPRGEWKTSQNGKRYFAEEKDKNGQPIMEAMRGQDLANAMKKAETQAKRRVTLSICGLGYASEAPQEGERIAFDATTGEIVEPVAFLAQPSEQGKGLDDHIADLFGDSQTPVTHGLPHGPLAQEINALLSQLGKDAPAIEEWWEEMRRRPHGLTHEKMEIAKGILQARLDDRGDIPDIPSTVEAPESIDTPINEEPF